MPEQETPTLELSAAVPNAKAANEKVATELANQGRESLDATHIETESLDTRNALEELRTKIQKEKADAAAKVEDEVEEPAPVVEKKEAPSKEASDATITPAKPDAEPVVASDKAGAPSGDDIFKGISLPPNIKPKSAEAFAAVKSKALEEISARDTKLTELEKLVKELEERTKQPADENLLKELEDHRNFRTKLDIELDPKFKHFDKDVADTRAFVYSQLLETGKVTQADIETIKKYGGPTKVNLEKVYELINDPHVQRVIESKITDEKMLHFKKEQAIKETKDNVAGYLKERADEYEKETKAHNNATQKRFEEITAKMAWKAPKSLPKEADAATKAEIEAYNKFSETANKDLRDAMVDDSPEMRAILLAGMGQLVHTQYEAKLKDAKLASVEKERDEAVAKLERIKGASKSRLPESSAPVGVKAPEPKKDDFSVPTLDALENIRKDILQKRTEKANA